MTVVLSTTGGRLWQRLRRSMTPGQFQTAVLAVVVLAAVLIQGAPDRTKRVEPVRQAAAAAPGAPPAAGVQAAAPATAAPSAEAVPALSTPASVSAIRPPATGGVPGLVSDPGATAPVTPGKPVKVVAVVAPAQGELPGHGDADMAEVFLGEAGIAHTAITLDPSDSTMCQRVTAAGSVVVTSEGLPQPLASCLTSHGAAVIGFDAYGSALAADGTAGVLSTRRGLQAGLLDLGAGAIKAHAVEGPVGIVSLESARRDVEAAAGVLRQRGVHVAATAYLADSGSSSTDVLSDVLAFSSKGVTSVMFALPVAQQQQWVTVASTVGARPAYLVSDAYDAVSNESYPPLFDGSMAVTSAKGAWFARTHGADAEQARCTQLWSAASPTASISSPDEQRRVDAWCVDVSVLSHALAAGPAAAPFVAALLAHSVASPLTSDVGPIADGAYGPRDDAVLTWSASCTCWVEKQPFHPRSS